MTQVSVRVHIENMVWIAGGTFRMGSNRHYPEEGPAHPVTVSGFHIDKYLVTNRQFARFVEATGHTTLAERPASPEQYPGAKPELLVPSSIVFRRPSGPVDLRRPYSWWSYVAGASWRHPLGPESSLEGKGDHPVVHVAYEDAQAYAVWAGKELPTEAEWEMAARGGLEGADYVWGDELMPEGVAMANTWHGEFPRERHTDPLPEGTTPVDEFPSNGYGLHDMAGNVWEWTTDYYQEHRKNVSGCCTLVDPRGAALEDSYDVRAPEARIPVKVMKGGSYLCAPNYCQRYRPAARMAQPIDTSTCHLGFRCVVRARSSGHR